MTNDQNQKNDQIQMSGPPPHPDAIGHWCLGFLWSFGIGPLSFARSEGLPHPHPDSVVQLAQTAGGDEGARFESGKDLLPPFLHAAELDFLRSEEHTSELQSQSNLVCRLLLEKKKKKKQHIDTD